MRIILCKRGTPVTWGTRDMVTLTLEKAGHQVTQIRDGPAELPAQSIVWISGNANWYPVMYRQLRAMPQAERPLVILWHTEPLPPPKAAGLPWPRLNWWEAARFILRDARATDVYTNYLSLRRWARERLPHVLVVSTLGRREFLAERGISAHWVPLGYDRSHGRHLGVRRDIDVLFLGALDVPRRNRLLDRLRQQGVHLLAAGSYVDPAYWGDNRTQLLNRAKILLHFARTPGELSGHRLILGMANKALVVSEPVYNPAPYVPGRHFISASLEEMPGVIAHYLAHDDERQRIADEAHRFVTQELTMERSVARILDLISQRANPALQEKRT